jgi:glutamate/aspartate transport system permease protein
MKYEWNWGIFFQDVAAGSGKYWEWYLSGFGWTIAVALLAWIIAFPIGSIVGIVRTTPSKWLTFIGDSYVQVFRNIPLIVQMFLWFFVLPELLPESVGTWIKTKLPLPSFTTAVVSLGFYTSARIAEQVKAGINSLPPGQKNASLALGMTLPSTYLHVLLPMAYRVILPPLTSEFMNVFKNSAVALTIGLVELTAVARKTNEYTFQGFEAFLAATVIYMGIALAVNRTMAAVEKRLSLPGYIGSSHKR